MSTQANTGQSDTHPLAGTRMSGADIVVQVLADENVETIFGYSGGAILPTYDAVFRYNAEHRTADGRSAMPLVVPANEQGAGFMAAGYARASGKVGVVMVTSGPGATNTVTPVRDCMADSVPIVVDMRAGANACDRHGCVPGSTGLCNHGRRCKARIPGDGSEPTRGDHARAFELARTGRPGPVVVDIPKDVQNWDGVFTGSGTLPLTGYRTGCRLWLKIDWTTMPASACTECSQNPSGR